MTRTPPKPSFIRPLLFIVISACAVAAFVVWCVVQWDGHCRDAETMAPTTKAVGFSSEADATESASA